MLLVKHLCEFAQLECIVTFVADTSIEAIPHVGQDVLQSLSA